MIDENVNKNLFAAFPPISKEEWIERINMDLSGADFEKKMLWHFEEGLDIQPFYVAEEEKENFYIGRNQSNNDWEIREEFDFSEISSVKEAIHRGAESVVIKGFNLEDNQSAAVLFDNIDLNKIPTHFTSVYSFPKLLTKLKKESELRSLTLTDFKGSFDFDYYSYYLFRKEFYHSFEANRRELMVLLEKSVKLLPKFKVININAKHYHNSGATMAQEIAFSLAHGAEYLTDCTDQGMLLQNILPRMQFTFATGSSYFMEIAKYRAARFLWDKIVKKFGKVNKKNSEMYIHSVSSSWNKTTYDSYLNILRTTTESMAAVIGGSNAITVSTYDSSYKRSSEFGKRVAKNQQIILKEEVKLNNVIDPSIGSYYIESATHKLIDSAWDIFLKISNMGGFRAALENDFIFDEIEKSAAKKNMEIAMRKINILGVNQFPNLEERKIEEVNFDIRPTKAGLKVYRGAQAFEDIRLRTEKFALQNNYTPKVFLLTFGDINLSKIRANFAINYFGCAGFQVIDNNCFASVTQGLKDAKKSKPDLLVVCSSDVEYVGIVKEISASKEFDLDKIIIAGYSKDFAEEIKNLGINKFIHSRSNILDELKSYQKMLSIK